LKRPAGKDFSEKETGLKNRPDQMNKVDERFL
jgi:hypothetical protein